jgi:hypothetical protein
LDGSLTNDSLGAVIIALSPGTGRVLTLPSVTGTIDPASGSNGPDGGNFSSTGVDIDSLGIISGVIDSSDRALALMGVFVADNPASTGSAPTRLDFTGNHSFASLSPLLNQSFFIGDGLTGTGSGALQQFLIPDSANFLQLGFADAYSTSFIPFVGGASAYGDNHGSLTVQYNIVGTSSVPEPGIISLLFAGLLGLYGYGKRTKIAVA